MNITISRTPEESGREAAVRIALELHKAIERQGFARLALSTGASQFDTLKALVKEPVDWSKVTMFHLDEYVGLPESHIASFRKYLKERFVSQVPLREAVFVNGEGDVQANIKELTRRITEMPIDVGVIGIGENGHVAFNDPPADFRTKESYVIVNLDDRCKQQQVGEGWFRTVSDVPGQAISMTVSQIMSCRVIVTSCPYAVKADAIRKTLETKVTNMVPATIMKTHPAWYLFIDDASAKEAFPIT
ncbi:MAG: 6-phosphogluconolactonase [Sphaerochaetaceae bacterium]